MKQTSEFSLEEIGVWEIPGKSKQKQPRLCVVCRRNSTKSPKGKYCQQCWEIRKKGLFKFNLVKKYGETIIQDLQDLKERPLITLDEIGKKYKLTRERVRQIYEKWHEEPYTIAFLNNCSIKLKCEDYEAGHTQNIHFEGEYLFYQECRKRNYKVKYIACGHGIDFVVNGKKVEVKLSRKPNRHGFYPVVLSKNQTYTDFVAAYIVPEKQWYIMPNSGHKCYNIPKDSKTFSKKATERRQYADAWHLLA